MGQVRDSTKGASSDDGSRSHPAQKLPVFTGRGKCGDLEHRDDGNHKRTTRRGTLDLLRRARARSLAIV